MPSPTPILERDVLRACLDALRAFGFEPQRRNVVAVEVEGRNGKRRLVRAGEPGEADITATVPTGPNRGKRVEVEVKRPGERPRPEQLAFLRRVNASGGLAFWVDDAAVLARVLRRLLDGWRVEIDDGGTPWLTDDPSMPRSGATKSGVGQL